MALARSRFVARLAIKVRNQCNCIIAYQLGETNIAEKNGELQVLKQLASHCHTFVDVGANVGNWTADFLAQNNETQGWLYEPSAQCVTKLETRFQKNHIAVRNMAVSNFIGETTFAEESSCGEGSSFVDTYVQNGHFSKREVKVITLDSEFCNTTATIDFLKIDTEGYDLKVLQGAEKLLTESRVRFIQFEYNNHWIRTSSTLYTAFDLLEKHGYSCFLIRSTGLHPFNYAFWGDFFRYSNFLAVKKEYIGLCEKLIRKSI